MKKKQNSTTSGKITRAIVAVECHAQLYNWFRKARGRLYYSLSMIFIAPSSAYIPQKVQTFIWLHQPLNKRSFSHRTHQLPKRVWHCRQRISWLRWRNTFEGGRSARAEVLISVWNSQTATHAPDLTQTLTLGNCAQYPHKAEYWCSLKRDFIVLSTSTMKSIFTNWNHFTVFMITIPALKYIDPLMI